MGTEEVKDKMSVKDLAFLQEWPDESVAFLNIDELEGGKIRVSLTAFDGTAGFINLLGIVLE